MGTTVRLYTEDDAAERQVTVPDVVGMSGQQANRTILNAGLNIKITGSGIESGQSIAAAQEPAAGTVVEPGTVVTVTFEEGPAESPGTQ
jgi:stage V sporulation protein D (sporulation-specific penicillin-binding protein)